LQIFNITENPYLNINIMIGYYFNKIDSLLWVIKKGFFFAHMGHLSSAFGLRLGHILRLWVRYSLFSLTAYKFINIRYVSQLIENQLCICYIK